ncbi:hypothetical protein [Microbacterium sp.]|uniref:hypothetical protein n=1 Tax=Microbacterium sp. TaxID=51671 RepID=UPI003A956C92
MSVDKAMYDPEDATRSRGTCAEPEDGPKLASRKRITEMRVELEESWSTDGDGAWPAEGPERDHLRKMLDLRWPPRIDRDEIAAKLAAAETLSQVEN